MIHSVPYIIACVFFLLAPMDAEYLVNAGNDPDETVRSAVVVTLQETALQDISCLTEKVRLLFALCVNCLKP